MAQGSGKKEDGGSWTARHHANAVERHPVTDCVLGMGHHALPFIDTWDESAGEAGLFAFATRYVQSADDVLGIPEPWLADLGAELPDQVERVQLRWLRFDDSDPRRSFWITRYTDVERAAPEGILDRTAILIACLGWPAGGDRWRPLFGGQGLRLVAHIGAKTDSGERVAHITSLSSTLPAASDALLRANDVLGGEVTIESLFKMLNEEVPSAFRLRAGTQVAELGLRLPESSATGGGQDTFLEVLVKTAPPPIPEGQPRREGAELSYALVGRVRRDRAQASVAIEPISRLPLVAFADAFVFKQDPMSRDGADAFSKMRPNRSWTALDAARDRVRFNNLRPGSAPNTVQLATRNGPVQVTNSRYVDAPLSEDDPKEVSDPAQEHVRTNTFAAVTAYYHASELFRRMVDGGIVPSDYFKFVSLPLNVRYRGGIVPGSSDGKTVNAQVVWKLRPTPQAPQGELQINFALADLQSSVMRSPLGIACDPRWNWHEFCHALLAAATGELEFRFAHSAGDALAAIVCDPASKLVDDPWWRGVTFPWVKTPARRHDREAHQGWSWAGWLNQRERTFDHGLCTKKGYWTEQILSSSLFRLYRAIGGDAQDAVQKGDPDRMVRGAASDYAVFVIMKAISAIGSASVAPALTPAQFVNALIDADRGNSVYGNGSVRRVGGAIGKVIRWAFERQGLYVDAATPLPDNVAGEPPPVDIFIDDGRRGGYQPISLIEDSWHARPNAFWVRRAPDGRSRHQQPSRGKDNFVYVKVENRGPVAANGVEGKVWYAPLNGGAIPDWLDPSWQAMVPPAVAAPAPIAGNNGSTIVGPFKWPAPQKGTTYALLAASSCPDDRANLDPLTGFPCALAPSPTVYLVACDNNLGLRLIDVR